MSSTGSASTRKTEPRAIVAARAGGLRGLPERALLLPLLPEPLPRPDDSAERARAARAGLVVMTALLLVGLCMALAFNRGRLAENDLLGVHPSPNLNSTSVKAAKAVLAALHPEPKRRSEPARALVQVAHQTPAVAEFSVPHAVHVSPVEVTRPFGSGIDRPAVADPAFLDELLASRIPHRGETPMIRNWKMFGMPTLLAAVLAAEPPPAAAQIDGPAKDGKAAAPPANSDTSPLKEITEQLKTLQKAVDDARAAAKDADERIKGSFAGVRQDFDSIKKDIGELRNGRVQADLNLGTAQRDLNQLKEQVTQLQKDVDELRRRSSTSSSVSAYNPAPGAANGGLARIHLRNTYFAPVTVRVNNRTYVLESGEDRLTDPVPVGAFTYEVLGVTPPRNRMLAAGDVFTIDVHPQG